ncbi:MAG: hypothetical protein R3F30_01255 [Planctomycetota bacterium]
MSMLPLLALSIAVQAGSGPAPQTGPGTEARPAVEKQPLRVLYAGDDGSERTEAWKRFLGRYFAGVGTVARTGLNAAAAKDFDVVIVDAESPYKANDIEIPKRAPLDLTWTRPTILMGAAGGSTLGGLKLKLDWL